MRFRSGVLFGVIFVAVVAVPLVAEAQAAKAPRVHLLSTATAPTPGESNPLLHAFWEGLRDLG